MKTLTLILTLALLTGCSDSGFPTRKLQEVKVVGHVPAREEGTDWASKKTVYEHWIYENTSTKERFIHTIKFGEVGETIKIRR